MHRTRVSSFVLPNFKSSRRKSLKSNRRCACPSNTCLPVRGMCFNSPLTVCVISCIFIGTSLDHRSKRRFSLSMRAFFSRSHTTFPLGNGAGPPTLISARSGTTAFRTGSPIHDLGRCLRTLILPALNRLGLPHLIWSHQDRMRMSKELTG
jgi:hypothetical protein